MAGTAATATATGCSAGSTATQDGRLRDSGIVVGATTAPASLDFTNTGGAAIPQALMGNVFETLVRIDADGHLVGHLATAYELSDDGLTYTFHLREGVRFSNGDAFTAFSAAATIDYVRTSWTNALKSQMAPVQRAWAVDDATLKVELRKPSNRWLWTMATLTGAMMTPNAWPAGATAPVGTGPYTVSRFVALESVSFARNPDYWGPPAAADAAIRYYSDAMSAVNGLLTGDVDVLYGMPSPELLASLPQRFTVDVGTTNGEVLLSMNNQAAPFDDVRVRRAVAHAIDRRAVSNVVWEGHAVDTGAAPVPPTDPWFSGRDYAPYSPATARDLLREAGYPDGAGPRVAMTVPSLPYAEACAELVYSQLRDVGFEVEMTTVEFPAVWLAQVMGAADYQMSIIAHVEFRDLPTLFGNPEGYLRFDDARTRALLDLADTTDDETEHMLAAVERITDLMPAVTVANLPNIVLLAPGVSGVQATVITDSIPLAGLRKE
ncbi:ABC-type dipeptide transport system, periplasmic component [Corynebacterium uterequi]|uniref:ABC-type dipeptide transport system, periplasmic component n=2 Tax=Corynebacterium uterequi TaxID=1072256 RepID=A0A0G3HE58_9CORY|nr:ABC-type dipeptide transport system, periplasmic component [Corynebacterium uterequi]